MTSARFLHQKQIRHMLDDAKDQRSELTISIRKQKKSVTLEARRQKSEFHQEKEKENTTDQDEKLDLDVNEFKSVAPIQQSAESFAQLIHSNQIHEQYQGLEQLFAHRRQVNIVDLYKMGIIKKLYQWIVPRNTSDFKTKEVPFQYRRIALSMLKYITTSDDPEVYNMMMRNNILDVMHQIFIHPDHIIEMEWTALYILTNICLDSELQYILQIYNHPYLIPTLLKKQMQYIHLLNNPVTNSDQKDNHESKLSMVTWLNVMGEFLAAATHLIDDNMDKMSLPVYKTLAGMTLQLFQFVKHPEQLVYLLKALNHLVIRYRSESFKMEEQGLHFVLTLLSKREYFQVLLETAQSKHLAYHVYSLFSLMLLSSNDQVVHHMINLDIITLAFQTLKNEQFNYDDIRNAIGHLICNFTASNVSAVAYLFQHHYHEIILYYIHMSPYPPVTRLFTMAAFNILQCGEMKYITQLVKYRDQHDLIDQCVHLISTANVDIISYAVEILSSVVKMECDIFTLNHDFDFSTHLAKCNGIEVLEALIRDNQESKDWTWQRIIYKSKCILNQIGELNWNPLNEFDLDDSQHYNYIQEEFD
jgi:hypothetical protein